MELFKNMKHLLIIISFKMKRLWIKYKEKKMERNTIGLITGILL
tara:strand:+ start:1561 stop:1692 length:132 start_codon:yes stop_codon:yes gene_type:complete